MITNRKFLFTVAVLFAVGCQQSYYIVRHAEKEVAPTNPSDPSLSLQGQERANALRSLLQDKKIAAVYVTKTKRSMQTAQPLADALGLTPRFYEPMPDQHFVQQVKKGKKNTLIVGHSNTVDDIVNSLAGRVVASDLPDSEYSKLYIITSKKSGTQVVEKTYGQTKQ